MVVVCRECHGCLWVLAPVVGVGKASGPAAAPRCRYDHFPNAEDSRARLCNHRVGLCFLLWAFWVFAPAPLS